MKLQLQKGKKVFSFSVHHPKKALFIAALIFIWSLSTLPKGHLDFSLEELYPKDSPAADFNDDHRKKFGQDDDVIFAIRKGDPFDESLASLESQIRFSPGIKSTVSPHSFSVLKKDEKEVFQKTKLNSKDKSPLYTNILISENENAGAVLIQLSPEVNHHELRSKIIENIEEISEGLGGEWMIGGVPMIRTSYIRLMISDLRVLIPLAALISAFFFIMSFRDYRHVLCSFCTIILGALLSVAIYISTGASFNVFAPAFIAVTLVVGTSDLIHLVHRFRDHHIQHQDTKKAAISAASEVGTACALTSFTTAIGFFALLATNIPPIRIFGLATGIGVIGTFLISFLIMPPLLMWLGPPSPKSEVYGRKRSLQLERIGKWTIASRKKLLWGWLCLSGILIAMSLSLKVDHRIFEDIEAIESVAETQAFMEENMGAILPLQIDITFKDDARNPENLEAIDKISNWLRDQPQMGHVLGLSDVYRYVWRIFKGDGADLPPTIEAAAQIELFMSLASTDESGEDKDLTKGLIVKYEGPDQYKRTRISSRMKDAGHSSTVDMVTRLREYMNGLLTPMGATGEVTGVAWMAQEVNSTLTRQFAGSFVIALSLIGLIWLVITRSIRRSFLALVPNLMPLLILLAMMGGTGLGLKPSTAMVLSVGLGIAVDDTVHFLAVYEQHKRSGFSKEEAIIQSYKTAGGSILDTSLCLGLGFLLFSFSKFGASYNFGMLTGFTIFAALISDLFLLGPLLASFDKESKIS